MAIHDLLNADSASAATRSIPVYRSCYHHI